MVYVVRMVKGITKLLGMVRPSLTFSANLTYNFLSPTGTIIVAFIYGIHLLTLTVFNFIASLDVGKVLENSTYNNDKPYEIRKFGCKQ